MWHLHAVEAEMHWLATGREQGYTQRVLINLRTQGEGVEFRTVSADPVARSLISFQWQTLSFPVWILPWSFQDHHTEVHGLHSIWACSVGLLVPGSEKDPDQAHSDDFLSYSTAPISTFGWYSKLHTKHTRSRNLFRGIEWPALLGCLRSHSHYLPDLWVSRDVHAVGWVGFTEESLRTSTVLQGR